MPGWQALRTQWYPGGLEVVTVALDTKGADAAREFIEAAQPEHPSLIDQAHLLDELYGIVNVPSGIWIDEEGLIVRPPEVAFPGKAAFSERIKGVTLPEDVDPYIVKALDVTRRLKRPDMKKYVAAVEDWIARGPDAEYALSPEEVVARSHERTEEDARAAAHFELGQHLHRAGHSDDAVEHFRQAHRLAPRNWTYKRQAWSFVDPLLQRARDVYGTDWASEAERLGPETYYESVDF